MDRLLYRPKEAATRSGLAGAALDLIRAGRHQSVKDGGARFITADALRAYVAIWKPKPPRPPDGRP